MILGITGGIASGKSTVSNYLKSKGIPIVDADAISHKITGKGTKGAKAIKKEFGEMFFIDGRIDRQKLGQYCFQNPERTERLNEITHPLIKEELEKQLALHRNERLIVLDAPLLIEAGLHKRCDKVLLVVCPKEKRVVRAIKRSNLPKLEVLKRIDRQMPDSERRQYADFIIDNSGDISKTLKQTDKILKELNYE